MRNIAFRLAPPIAGTLTDMIYDMIRYIIYMNRLRTQKENACWIRKENDGCNVHYQSTLMLQQASKVLIIFQRIMSRITK